MPTPLALSAILVLFILIPFPAWGQNADFDNNGQVNLSDFFLFVEHFGSTEPRYDLNGDNQVGLDDFFLLAEAFQTPPKLQVLKRNYSIKSQTDLDRLTATVSGNFKIEGNLVIANSSLADLRGLSQLVEVSGNLAISANTALESLTGLEQLREVGGDLELSNNKVLGNLHGLVGLNLVNKDLWINSNNAVQNLEGLENLVYTRTLAISHNQNLTNIKALKNLQGTLGLDVWRNGALRDLSGLENISTLITIWIGSNNSLTSLTGLENTTHLYRLSITGNSELVDLQGLKNLRSISHQLEIDSAESLVDLTGLENLRSVGEPLDDCAVFMSAPPAPGRLKIHGCDSLQNLAGLENLVGTPRIFISENRSLTNLGALAKIKSLETLEISDNPKLKDLLGLHELELVSGELLIERNGFEGLAGFTNLIHVGSSKTREGVGSATFLGSPGQTALSPVDTAKIGPSQDTLPGRLIKLTDNAAADTRPRISPDGTQLLFISDRLETQQIYLMDANGDNLQPTSIENTGRDMAWAPNSQSFTYLVDFTDSSTPINLAIVNSSDFSEKLALEGITYIYGTSRWTPDGQALLIHMFCPDTGSRFIQRCVWLYSIPEEKIRNVATGNSPTLSPDGNQVAFFTTPAEGQPDRPLESSVWIKDINSATETKIARLYGPSSIKWSPNDRFLALRLLSNILCFIDLNGTDGPCSHCPLQGIDDYVWSPDGQQLAVVMGNDIYLVGTDGGFLAQLTSHPADDSAPNWAPDGSHIYFHSNRSGNYDIYSLKLTD